MIFSQSVYFLLLGVSVASFFLVPRGWRRHILIISGITFYGYFAGIYVFLVAGEVLLLYLLLRQRSIYRFLLGLVLTVGTLVYFKYGAFTVEILNNLRTFVQVGLALPVGKLATPLAVSFFTFEFIHLVVDRYRGKIKALSFTEFSAFAFFFPSLIAGPIKRFNDFNEQIDQAVLSPEHLTTGVYRILRGLIKKIVVANTLLTISGGTLTTSLGVQMATVPGIWLALVGFAWRIYFDFSGYSDIAIGSGRLFGIIIPENFTQPYFQTNIAAFWRNWHRTLTRWIIDYIYIPLGGNRWGLLSTCSNTLVAMAVCGLWHGAEVNFFFWGVYHGILLIIYRLYKTAWRPLAFPRLVMLITRVISRLFTFLLVAIGWLLFVAPFNVAIAAFTKLMGVNK